MDEYGHHVFVIGIYDGVRYVYEYVWDEGKMDFMVFLLYCIEDNFDDDVFIFNMSCDGFDVLMDVLVYVIFEFWGVFVVILVMEWSINLMGNYVNIFGSSELSKMVCGWFDLLYEEFLLCWWVEGEYVLFQFNHLCTF